MNYKLIDEAIHLIEDFESSQKEKAVYPNDIHGFKEWVADGVENKSKPLSESEWDGKNKGRSPESVINTLIVHLNRFAKTYSKAAMHDSDFSTQDEFIFLINLKAFGPMTKMELIKRNIQEKPTGMLIINRLSKQGWVTQTDSSTDKRSKILAITPSGLAALDQQMDKIRTATKIVAGDLTGSEKQELIKLLTKLDDFHYPIFARNIDTSVLLETVSEEYKMHTAGQ